MSHVALADPALPRLSIRPARSADLTAIVGLFADDEEACSPSAHSVLGAGQLEGL